jgi:hypothetical protein
MSSTPQPTNRGPLVDDYHSDDEEEEFTKKRVSPGDRVIAKWKDSRSCWFSGNIESVDRNEKTCEIGWCDGGVNSEVKFKWIRFSHDSVTAAHKDVGKNKKNQTGMVGDMWDGGEHRFKDLDKVINSYEPRLNVIEIY